MGDLENMVSKIEDWNVVEYDIPKGTILSTAEEEHSFLPPKTTEDNKRPFYSHPSISKYKFTIHEQKTSISGHENFYDIQTRIYEDGPVERVVASDVVSNLFFRRGLISQLRIEKDNTVTKYVELDNVKNFSFKKIINLHKILQNDIVDAQFSYEEIDRRMVLTVKGTLKAEFSKFYQWRNRIDKSLLNEV